MTRKQLLTPTEIAKMDGENKVHFLNPQARRRNKSLGDAACQPYDLRNTGAELMICLVAVQRLPFDVAIYSEKREQRYRVAGQPWDLVDINAIEHPATCGRTQPTRADARRLPFLNAWYIMGAFGPETVGQVGGPDLPTGQMCRQRLPGGHRFL